MSAVATRRGDRGDGAGPASAVPLPRLVTGTAAGVWWGMLFLVTIETVVFASLITTYFYLRAGAAAWPPGGIDAPPLLLPATGTLALVLSAVVVAITHRRVTRGQVRRLEVGKLAGMALVLLYAVLKVVEYAGYDFDWRTNAYGSIVWTMTGFHLAHALVIVLESAAITVLALDGFFTEERYLAVEAIAVYWYFVTLISLPLYAVIYLSPRLL